MERVGGLRIPAHVHGYPRVAFGGYVAGLLAARAGADAELRVDFRRPVPVEAPLMLTTTDSGGHALTDPDGAILAESSKAAVTIGHPSAPSWEQVVARTEAVLDDRRVTDCYGCGSACAPGRGLRLFPAVLDDMIVAAWTPAPELGGPDGTLSPENVWAALDCPGGWAGIELLGMRYGSAVTAALTGTRYAPIHAGERYISYAWPISAEGRKYTVGVAIATPDGAPRALAEALWIQPRTTPTR
ncbi:hypothetical protein [Nocardia arizonensis]|uniref:hypothetical protein n=1 Tax=Nocardia arizonensis TaxID=1141647 RepID=UPI0006D171F1|nr:hypothetical protein [Nocardia arizonensis]